MSRHSDWISKAVGTFERLRDCPRTLGPDPSSRFRRLLRATQVRFLNPDLVFSDLFRVSWDFFSRFFDFIKVFYVAWWTTVDNRLFQTQRRERKKLAVEKKFQPFFLLHIIPKLDLKLWNPKW